MLSSGMLRGLWEFRGFILSSVKREFQSKYRNSLLGALWMVINPLAMILVYTVIFSQVMSAKLPGIDSTFSYSIYLCAGILTWGFFAEITGRAQNMFLEQANLLKKLSFPRLCLPVIVVVNASLNFSIIFILFTLFLLLSDNFPGWSFIALVPVLAIQTVFAIGLGMSLGVLNVFFRDVGQLFGVVLQFWFWLTPIIYPITILPERFRPMMSLNPMAQLVEAYQNILVSNQWPDWNGLLPVALLAILLCTLGAHLFRKHSGEMVDEL
jgi:lipopolysaccharide transport system permease protein|tara:strand:+ start:5506 stop:6306 length:801 start_codon:yes stop_codon:yes gene_type:complete